MRCRRNTLCVAKIFLSNHHVDMESAYEDTPSNFLLASRHLLFSPWPKNTIVNNHASRSIMRWGGRRHVRVDVV